MAYKRTGQPVGRPRLEPAPTHRELFEGFCCQQVERIERHLAYRFGRGYDGRSAEPTMRENGGCRSFLMPANDHFTRPRLMTDCDIEVRR